VKELSLDELISVYGGSGGHTSTYDDYGFPPDINVLVNYQGAGAYNDEYSRARAAGFTADQSNHLARSAELHAESHTADYYYSQGY